MTFVVLLTKELRSRMRRERMAWSIIVYVIVMCLLGWYVISRFANDNNYGSDSFSMTGTSLYIVLSMLQLFLVLFITPAYTATAINGEKERRTFDLLMCSQLSALALIAGKLVAGMINALLLIAASIPLFSLVLFFGGIAPAQILCALLVYIATALLGGMYGLFCSTVVDRPPVSTAITYLSGVLWMILPLIIVYLWYNTNSHSPPSMDKVLLLFLWNPVIALVSTYPGGGGLPPYIFGSITIAAWPLYLLLCLAASAILFVLSIWIVKPYRVRRFQKDSQHNQAPGQTTAETTQGASRL